MQLSFAAQNMKIFLFYTSGILFSIIWKGITFFTEPFIKKIVKYLCLIVFSFYCNAADVLLTWTVEKTNNIAGYYLFFESDSGLSSLIDVENVNYHKLSISENKYYYFIITPYDANRREGKPSEMLIFKYTNSLERPKLSVPKLRIKKVK